MNPLCPIVSVRVTLTVVVVGFVHGVATIVVATVLVGAGCRVAAAPAMTWSAPECGSPRAAYG